MRNALVGGEAALPFTVQLTECQTEQGSVGPYFDVELHCFALSQAAEAVSLDACLQAVENLSSGCRWWAPVKQPALVAGKISAGTNLMDEEVLATTVGGDEAKSWTVIKRLGHQHAMNSCVNKKSGFPAWAAKSRRQGGHTYPWSS